MMMMYSQSKHGRAPYYHSNFTLSDLSTYLLTASFWLEQHFPSLLGLFFGNTLSYSSLTSKIPCDGRQGGCRPNSPQELFNAFFRHGISKKYVLFTWYHHVKVHLHNSIKSKKTLTKTLNSFPTSIYIIFYSASNLATYWIKSIFDPRC